MGHRHWIIAATFSCLLVAGCGKKYSPACSKDAELTPPFTELGLPTSQGRVCESDGKRAKLEFRDSDEAKWKATIEQAVTSAGYTKEKCPSYCVYTRGTERLQVIVGDIANKWVTVTLIASTGRASNGGGDADGDGKKSTAASAASAASAATDDVEAIPACRSYFAKLRACPPAKGPVSRQEEADIKKRELTEKLEKGSRPETIRRTCELFEKMLKC
jgi:hypothetical protein